MTYKIVKHVRRGNTRIIDVDTGTKTENGEPVVETFQWGMDVSMAAVRKETRALLEAKYGNADVPLAGAGTDL